jgi:hypothetical protein
MQVRPVRIRQIAEAAQDDPFLLQGREHVGEQRPVLDRDQLAHELGDALELLGWRHAIGPGAALDAGLHLLLQAAYPHHEELIEVRAEDCQKLQPLEQWHLGVLGLLQHPAIELEPAQLPVEIEGGIVECRSVAFGGGDGQRDFFRAR